MEVTSFPAWYMNVITCPFPFHGREDSGNNQKQKGRLTPRATAGPGWGRRGDNRGEKIKAES